MTFPELRTEAVHIPRFYAAGVQFRNMAIGGFPVDNICNNNYLVNWRVNDYWL